MSRRIEPADMPSWHDFHITGYAVDGKLRKLAFHLEWPYDTATDRQRAKLTFTGVECYFLEHDLESNIVHSVEEGALLEFLTQWASHFESQCKWGWPKFWRPVPHHPRGMQEELDDALRFLGEKGVRCFYLSSSYGLSGWVLALHVRHAVVKPSTRVKRPEFP